MRDIIPYRVGEWLPSDQEQLQTWICALALEASDETIKLHPVIEDFKNLIETDAEVYMLFNLMFTQVPNKPPYNNSPTNKSEIKDYHHMLRMMNVIMTKAPEFLEIDGQPAGLIGFPINAILDWPMGTTAGFAAFLNEKVNLHLKKILDEWGSFLKSPESAYVLTDKSNGWFGSNAFAPNAMPDFETNFKYEPSEPHFGYSSWDDFFTREFKEGQRPIASPDDDNVIVNACESAPYRCAPNVQLRDKFWIKAQRYSLEHMLANDSLVDTFVGGTVYQAFLSALSYHRWHSPVSGKVIKTKVVNGSYYSEPLIEGFANPDGPDPSAPNDSQGYLAEVATRALIFIEADNPLIGLICFIAVGMAEVSTCDITVKEGQHISKGDQTGMFHFGGSTHCLIFRPESLLEFDFHGQTPGLKAGNIPINSKIATVRPRVS
ncbi:MAG: phosphatidylserine decarboxylase family protein [Candidatus Scalindua sp.]|jgi:phosphatidylserine decarboxylase|nr:phosphatidylserine decarboxylase family protein [Candidatus Scalindua sp.]MBT5304742.1 phosphatidylserine decarboxylase family protein [Candidatus Scalindua sp.]MBT6560996.1 phosphatidylserine decarboxylase family protein [Candidatus Scalindua sp.]MBT7213129.1 phosphatidylserine decarboxylase family protein [Candidatus Scalindua sp.]MBT7592818.1 phosphatidylserine decarboxylase family protein [Candidatus Scalindua sp.]